MTEDQNIFEALKIIKSDSTTHPMFFSQIKSVKWFYPLKEQGYFLPDKLKTKSEDGKLVYVNFWPQLEYLKKVCLEVAEGRVVEDKLKGDVAEIFRNIRLESEHYYLGKSLFETFFDLPLDILKEEDVDLAFSWLNLNSDLNHYVVSGVLTKMLSRELKDVNSKAVAGTYFRKMLAGNSKREKRREELLFFPEHQLKDLKKNVASNFPGKEMAELFLKSIFERMVEEAKAERNDESSLYLRPAVEDHPQNNYHNASLAKLIELYYFIAKLSLDKGFAKKDLKKLETSKLWTVRRIYLTFAAEREDFVDPDLAAKKLLSWGIDSRLRHEAFRFLQLKWNSINKSNKNSILSAIEKLKFRDSDDSEQRKRIENWERLRWLMALKGAKDAKSKNLLDKYLKLTGGNEPDHPDFSSYMSGGWVGPTSPLESDELDQLETEELFGFLMSFENDEKSFGSPSVEGMARTLQDFVSKNPLKHIELIDGFWMLPSNYQAAILEGLSQAWNSKKYFDYKIVVELVENIVLSSKFQEKLKSDESVVHEVVSPICRFISSTCSDDSNAADNASVDIFEKVLVEFVNCIKPSERYNSFSDAVTRSINEPRGKIFETYIVLCLHKARKIKVKGEKFNKSSEKMLMIFDDLLAHKNSQEISLYAMLGANYRQLMYLNKNWVLKRLFPSVPKKKESSELWTAFFDGFGYVAAFVKESYEFFRDRGDMIEYMRGSDEVDTKESYNKNRLENRVIELSVLAYLFEYDSLKKGIVKDIIAKRNPEEWQQLSWSVYIFLKDGKNKKHVKLGLRLIEKLIEIAPWQDGSEDWKTFFSSTLRMLDILSLKDSKIIDLFFKKLTVLAKEPWELHEYIDFLDRVKDGNPQKVADLYLTLLDQVKTPPTYPEEKITSILTMLSQTKQKVEAAKIARKYRELYLSEGPLKKFCESFLE